MIGEYVGYVAGSDPLHTFLGQVMRDRLGVRESAPAYRAFRLAGSNEVYAYQEKHSRARLICKFYGPRFGWDRDRAAGFAAREYEGLATLRRFDLVGSPHHVIRPLGLSREINSVIALEYYAGEQLSSAIDSAIRHGQTEHLYWRLKALAYFLATQHDRTANGYGVDFGSDRHYFDLVLARLQRRGRIGEWDVEEFGFLADRWAERPRMWQDQQVWLHGDATPANFLFGHGLDVGAIDLERMKRGDRVFDIGRVAGELQHAFMRATGDPYRAEPFIGHFLWEYSCHFPDRGATFESVTARVPYYLGLNLLRIAANDYIDQSYGGRLVDQAKQSLRTP